MLESIVFEGKEANLVSFLLKKSQTGEGLMSYSELFDSFADITHCIIAKQSEGLDFVFYVDFRDKNSGFGVLKLPALVESMRYNSGSAVREKQRYYSLGDIAENSGCTEGGCMVLAEKDFAVSVQEKYEFLARSWGGNVYDAVKISLAIAGYLALKLEELPASVGRDFVPFFWRRKKQGSEAEYLLLKRSDSGLRFIFRMRDVYSA